MKLGVAILSLSMVFLGCSRAPSKESTNKKDIIQLQQAGLESTKRHEYFSALASLNRAADLDPGDAWTYAMRGHAKFQLKQWDEAAADYTKAIELEPATAGSYFLRGVDFYFRADKGKMDHLRAFTNFSDAIERDPSRAEFYFFRGATIEKFGCPGLSYAVEDYSKAIELDHDHELAYRNRARIRNKSGEFEGALADYSEVLRLKPDAPTYKARANLHLKFKNYSDAIADLSNAIQLKGDDASFYVLRGIAHGKSNNKDSAAADYKTALRINPIHETAQKLLNFIDAETTASSLNK